jgi:hypothetical protein
MSNREILRPVVRAVMATALALLPYPALSQSDATIEIMCPEKTQPLVRVDYFYSIDRPSSFTCWYKSPSELAGKLPELPVSLDAKGKCSLQHTDEIADMRGAGSGGFTSGRQTCSGDRLRCAVTCRPQ